MVRTKTRLRLLLRLLLLGLAVPLAGCGDGDGPKPVDPGPVTGKYVGQEIWITYKSEEFAKYGRRTGRTQGEARTLAEKLRRRVIAGEDIGPLARAHSNALGGAADGFTGVLPRDKNRPDARDRAMASLKVGGVSELVDWYGGYWFAKRVDLRRAVELEKLFDTVRRERVRFRAIAILYVGADINDAFARDGVRRSRGQAIEKAQQLLEEIQGGADFAELARIHTEDGPSAERGGLVRMVTPGKPSTEWIRRGYLWIPASVLKAAFGTPPGQVHPEVIATERGVFLVKVEEKKLIPE